MNYKEALELVTKLQEILKTHKLLMEDDEDSYFVDIIELGQNCVYINQCEEPFCNYNYLDNLKFYKVTLEEV